MSPKRRREASSDEDSDGDLDLTALDDEDIDDLDEVVDEDPNSLEDESLKKTLQKWTEFFNEKKSISHKIPGNPTVATDVLKASSPELDAATIVAYLVFRAKSINAAPKGIDKEAVASKSTIDKEWYALRRLLVVCRHQLLSPTVTEHVLAYVKTEMVEKGLVTFDQRRRTITDVNGVEAIAHAALHPAFVGRHPRAKLQALFYIALEMHTGARGAHHFPTKKRNPDEPFMMHKHWTIVVCHHPTENQLELEYTPPRHKTRSTEGQVIRLKVAKLRWQCPVRSYLALAALDNALEYPVEEMLDPTFVRAGDNERRIRCTPDARELPVCVTATGETWAVYIIINTLGRLSELAGFDFPLRSHSFRRMVATYMSINGETDYNVAMKLGHQIMGHVHKTYMAQMPTTDVGSIVGGGPNLLPRMIGFHPEAVTAIPGHTVAVVMSHKDRLEVLQNPELVEVRNKCRRRRDRCIEAYGSDKKEWPSDTSARLKSEWKAFSKLYRRLYYQKLATINDGLTEANTVIADEIPEEGEDLEYNVEAAQAFLTELTSESLASLPTTLADMDAAQDPVPDHLEDPTSVQASDQQHLEGSTSVQASPQQLEAAPSSSSSAQTGNVGSENPVPALTVNTPHVPPLDGFTPPLANRLAEFKTFVFTANEETGSDVAEYITRATAMIRQQGSRVPGRPLHYPLPDGYCPAGCGEKIDDQHTKITASHLRNCLAAMALREQLDQLLAKYPRVPIEHPLPKRKKNLEFAAGQPEVHLYRLSDQMKSSRMPIYCRCGAKLGSRSLAQAHFVSHGWHTTVLMPSAPNAAKTAYNNGDWSQLTARFAKPYYCYEDGKYYPDPEAAEAKSQSSYERRVVDAGRKVSRYLIRDDVVLPQDFDTDSINIAVAGTTTAVVDRKYDLVVSDAGQVDRPGLCILCVNEPGQSYYERMAYHEEKRNFHEHCRRHLKGQVHDTLAWKQLMLEDDNDGEEGSDADSGSASAEAANTRGRRQGRTSQPKVTGIRRYRPPPSIYHPESRGWRCPDLVCARSDLHFEELDDLVKHLVLIHSFAVKSKVFKATDVVHLSDVLPEGIVGTLMPEELKIPSDTGASISSLRGFRSQAVAEYCEL